MHVKPYMDNFLEKPGGLCLGNDILGPLEKALLILNENRIVYVAVLVSTAAGTRPVSISSPLPFPSLPDYCSHLRFYSALFLPSTLSALQLINPWL